MTPTVEERLAAYRQVLDEAIDAELAVAQQAATPRRWQLLVPLIGAVAAASVLTYVMIGDERTMTSSAPAAPASVSDAAPILSVAPTPHRRRTCDDHGNRRPDGYRGARAGAAEFASRRSRAGTADGRGRFGDAGRRR